nr:MAG TPA: hypothetical protein [Crassvirales sp.]
MDINKAKEQIAAALAYVDTMPFYDNPFKDKLRNRLAKCLDTAYKSLSE